VDEVVRDLRAFEDARDRVALRRVRDRPGHAVALLVLAPRDRDDLVLAREPTDERPTDCSRGAEHDDLHASASAISRRK
jgi:hypothetical protein